MEAFRATMVRINVLNDALKTMYNAEKIGKHQVLIRPSSKVIIKVLLVMQRHGYIGEFEYVDDHRFGKIVVELNRRLNKCGINNPRFDVGVKEIESWTARLLLSRQFGYIVLTTSAGIIDHEEGRRKNVGCNTPAQTLGRERLLTVARQAVYMAHISTRVLSSAFCPHSCASREPSQEVTHPKTTPSQARLTVEFFCMDNQKRKCNLLI